MKDKILKFLKEADGYVSGQELCERLGVSRTAIWKAIRQLESEGYEIEAVRNRGYCLHDSADILNEAEIRAALTTKWLGHPVKFLEEIDSTKCAAWRNREHLPGRLQWRKSKLQEKDEEGEAGVLQKEAESGTVFCCALILHRHMHLC